MTPEQLAKSGTEDAHQRATFQWCALNQKIYPELMLLFHIPNGGARGDDAKTRMIRGGQMKAAGVKPGVSDLFLPVARGWYHGLFIEMKKPALKKANNPLAGASQDQLEFADKVQAQGFAFALCYTWEEATAALIEYLKLERG